MSHNRPRGDEGYRLGMQMTGLGVALGALVARAHEDGMAAMEQARADQEAAKYDAWARGQARNARDLEALARSLVNEVLTLRESDRKLRKLLAQRQAVIDGMRGR